MIPLESAKILKKALVAELQKHRSRAIEASKDPFILGGAGMWSFQVKIKSDKEIFSESRNQKPLDESQALVILKQGDNNKKKKFGPK